MKSNRGMAARRAMPVVWCAFAALLFRATFVAADEPPVSNDTPAAVPARTEREEMAATRIFAGEVPKNVADLKSMQQRLQRLSESLIETTVGIRIGAVRGSGVIVSADGTVLTAAHVIQRADVDCEVVLHDGRVLKAKTLGLNKNVDAGMIRILVEGNWPVAEISEHPAKVGQWCLAVGHPGGYEVGRKPVVRFGRILEASDSVLISDCTLVGGDSGGPLFDADGRVIGVHSRIGNMLAANLHVPAKAYQQSWSRLAQSDVWGHLPGQSPFLGVRGDSNAKSATVAEVFDGMPAAKAGLKVGDIVTSFDGEPIADFATLSKMVLEKNPDDKIPIVVRRGDQLLTLEVVLGRR